MKIMYITDQIYLHGGVEKVLSQKANWFADKNGDEVWIITSRQENKKSVYNFSEKITFTDLEVNYDTSRSYFHPSNLAKVPGHYQKLKQMLKKVKPDVVISCNFAPDFYFLPSLLKGILKIKEFHGSRALLKPPVSKKEKFIESLNRRTEKAYDVLALLNPDEVKYYNSGNTVVIPNPAEQDDGRTADLSQKKVLAAGRISPVKNFEALIESWNKIAREHPDWQLHIFGEDYLDTKSKLEYQISENQLEASVKLMPATDKMKETMLHYSIYAMTSESECFPMVLLESLGCGIPVVTFDCPTGPRNIVIDESDSFLVPNKNLDIFAQKLSILMDNEALRRIMGANAKENVKRFEIELVMQKWQSLFKELSKAKSN